MQSNFLQSVEKCEETKKIERGKQKKRRKLFYLLKIFSTCNVNDRIKLNHRKVRTRRITER